MNGGVLHENAAKQEKEAMLEFARENSLKRMSLD